MSLDEKLETNYEYSLQNILKIIKKGDKPKRYILKDVVKEIDRMKLIVNNTIEDYIACRDISHT